MTTLPDLTAASSVGFGTSGARGLVSDLTPGLSAAFVQAFLSLPGLEQRRLVVGHDLRPSSPGIASAVIAAVRQFGIGAVYAGAVPTPALALAAMDLELPAIMVTGSHVPFDRNGLKFYRAAGEISKADERAMLAMDVAVPAPFVLPPLPDADISILERYIDRYRNFFSSADLRGLRIGVYEQSSVGRDLLHVILRDLGAETLPLGRSDKFVAIDTEAIGAEDQAQAWQWSNALQLDAIVTTDGDGDRPMLADEHGEWLRGDTVGLLCAAALGVEVIVTPVSSSTAAERSDIARQVIRTRIGSPHVIAAMEQAAYESGRIVAGYEANGGFLLGSDVVRDECRLRALPTRDAMLPLIAVLAEARRRGLTVSKLSATLPQRFTDSGRLQSILSSASLALINRLQADPAMMAQVMAPQSGPIGAVDLVDGLRVSFASGDIVHLRPSGNAPELRCYTESDTALKATALCADCIARVAGILPPPAASHGRRPGDV